MEDKKNYFEVYEIRADRLMARLVNSDGSASDYSETWAGEDRVIEYVVNEYDGEYGTLENTKHYVVGGTMDEEEALEQIKKDHEPDLWQNNNW